MPVKVIYPTCAIYLERFFKYKIWKLIYNNLQMHDNYNNDILYDS